jgi:tRNA threonylcarbamoyladenosine biosynthesis protein TsaE
MASNNASRSDQLVLADVLATEALGANLARLWLDLPLDSRPILLLEGDLGAGKTSLVQGLAAGLGIAEPITSPTFALAQHYSGQRDDTPTQLVHLDLYRLEQPAAADELFAQEQEEAQTLGALLAVEWPGRLSAVPEDVWFLQLTLLDPARPEAGRSARIRASGSAPPAAPATPR